MRIVLFTAQKGYRTMQLRESQINPDAARIEPDDRRVVVHFGGVTIANTSGAVRVTEAGHPPVFYIPPEDVMVERLEAVEHQTECPHKGIAHYYDIIVGDERAASAAWCYPEPKPEFESIQHAIAFYPARIEATVDGRPVEPEGNQYYGGWVIED